MRKSIKYIVLAILLLGGLTFFLSSDSSAAQEKASFFFDTSSDFFMDHPFVLTQTFPDFQIAEQDQATIENSFQKYLTINDNADYLKWYEVCPLLDSVLIDRGIDLVKDTTLIFGNVKIPVTSYSPTSKLGYIWLSLDRLLEVDSKNDRSAANASQRKSEQTFMIKVEDGLELFFDDEATFLDDVFGIVKEELSPEEEINKQEALSDYADAMAKLRAGETEFMDIQHIFERRNKYVSFRINRTLRKWDFFGRTHSTDSEIVMSYNQEVRNQLASFNSDYEKREYLEIILIELRKKLEVEYITSKSQKSMLDEWKLSAAEMIEEPHRFFGVCSRIDHMRFHSPNQQLTQTLQEQILQISLYGDSDRWWNHTNAIISLFNVNRSPVLYNKDSYHNELSDIMRSSPYGEWPDQYYRLQSLADREMVSYEELQLLSAMAYQKGICIAPIWALDDRLVYDMQEEEYHKKLDELRQKVSETKDNTRKKVYKEQLIEMTNHRAGNYNQIRNQAQEKSKSLLLENINLFLDWAKTLKQDGLAEA